jgi:hypothetical protein
MIPHWIIKAMCFFARIRAVPKSGLTQRHRQRVLRLVCVVALGAAVYLSCLSMAARNTDDQTMISSRMRKETIKTIY